jgi:hypothetical protein
VTFIAGRLQRTPAQVALRWGLQMGQSVLPKSTDEARIKENLDIFGWSIPEELMAEFSEIEQACSRRCSFLCICKPCVFTTKPCYALPRCRHTIFDLFPWYAFFRLSCLERSLE